MLVQVSASLDGRPLAVDRANVVGLARYLADLDAFRDVYAPEALDAGLESAARIELEEHYVSGASRGYQRELEATTRLRVQLPGVEAPLELEARASGKARSGGQAREALIARLQQANLDDLGAQLRAEPRLFTPAPAPP